MAASTTVPARLSPAPALPWLNCLWVPRSREEQAGLEIPAAFNRFCVSPLSTSIFLYGWILSPDLPRPPGSGLSLRWQGAANGCGAWEKGQARAAPLTVRDSDWCANQTAFASLSEPARDAP